VTTLQRYIHETVVPGRRLGRHVHHDSRSLAYQVRPSGTVVSRTWKREIPVLDQGDLGSCTGNATVGVLGSDPFYQTLPGRTLDESEAVTLYSAAEKIDGGEGYPPEDDGSTGLSVAKAAKNAGLISGYLHMTSVAACQTAIASGPFIIGSDWYEGFDNPTPGGLVTISGQVRGGHEYECIGYDAASDLWQLVNSWGTSYGVAGHFFYTSATLAKLLAAQGDATSFVPITAPAPVPMPSPADLNVVVFHSAVLDWANARHTGSNKAAAAAARALFAAEGLPT
jgi:hypothetical protein